MKALTKSEVNELYSKLTELAYSIAKTLSTTPAQSNDPICSRWRKFLMIEEVDDNALILMSEESNSPLFVMDNSNSSSSNAYSHILAIDSTFFKKASNSDKMLVIEYTNGQVEYYQRHELLKDVYCPITGKRSRFSFTFKRSANR